MSLHVAYVTSEMVPFVKTGGLADVSGALPKALVDLGHRVTVFVPLYRGIPRDGLERRGAVHVPLGGGPSRSARFHGRRTADGVEVVFVEHDPFFDRGAPYGDFGGEYDDNRLRFAFFARSVLEYFRARDERPDVIHAHDWQAALVPVYLKAFYWTDPTLQRLATVFTVHNLAYQGRFGIDTLSELGFGDSLGTRDTLEYHGDVSYMKGGLLFSEVLTTVSPQYALEIQRPEFGFGLDGVLRSRAGDLVGILNGVDYEDWNPETDTHLVRRYSSRDLTGKVACKAALLKEMGLPAEPDLPLVGVISRLVPQKGFDVVTGAWWDLLRRDMRFVALGTGDADLQEGMLDLQRRAPDRFAVRIGYDEGLAHRIEAGADIFLMPSRYEPCGLTQMYSLRYGTVPVVRSTGGLVDSVEPFDPATGTGTGFRFDAADGTGMMWALDQALDLWPDRVRWRELMREGMSRDFSWARSARGYVEAYERAIAAA